jgi:hypothetical protein
MDQKISKNKTNIQILKNRKIKDPIIKIGKDQDHLAIKIKMKNIITNTAKNKTNMKRMKEINTD